MAKDEIRLSPVGIAIFPHLSRPTRDMLDKKDVWEVYLEVDPKDQKAKDFLNELSSDTLGKFPKEGRVPYKEQVDRDSGESTGKIVVCFRSFYAPKLFDIYDQDISNDIIIGTGSLIQVAFKVNFYEVGDKRGMNLYLQAVMVKKLIQYQGMKATDYGFKVETKPKKSLKDIEDAGEKNKVADTIPNIPKEYEKGEKETEEIPF